MNVILRDLVCNKNLIQPDTNQNADLREDEIVIDEVVRTVG